MLVQKNGSSSKKYINELPFFFTENYLLDLEFTVAFYSLK